MDPKIIKPGEELPFSDTRIVFGAKCTWWGTIQEAGRRQVHDLSTLRAQLPAHMQGGMKPGFEMPCCPYCEGMLFEVENYQRWEELIAQKEPEYPGYSKLYMWLRGRCFSSMGLAKRICEAKYGSLGWQPRMVTIPGDATANEAIEEARRREKGVAERPWQKFFDMLKRGPRM